MTIRELIRINEQERAKPQVEPLPYDVAINIESMCKSYWAQYGPTDTWQTGWRWLAKCTVQARPTDTEANDG